MNLHSVVIWHPRDSNGVVFRVWLLSYNHREPVVIYANLRTKQKVHSPPDPLDKSNKEDEEFSFDKRFSHADPLSMAQGYKVVRSEELPVLVEEPFKRDWGKSSPLVRSSTSLG